MAAQQSGQLTSLALRRGDQIKVGTPLFSHEQATEAAIANQARASLLWSQKALSAPTRRIRACARLARDQASVAQMKAQLATSCASCAASC